MANGKEEKIKILERGKDVKSFFKQGVKHDKIYSNPSTILGVTTFLLIVILTTLVSLVSPNLRSVETFKVGDVSPKNIKAPFDFSLEDVKATKNRQKEAEEGILAIYDFEGKLQKNIKLKVEKFFDNQGNVPEVFGSEVDNLNETLTPKDNTKTKEKNKHQTPDNKQWVFSDEVLAKILEEYNLKIDEDKYKKLIKYQFDPQIKEGIINLVSVVLGKGIVSNENLLLAEKGKGITIQDLQTKEKNVAKDTSQILSMEKALGFINRQVKEIFPNNKDYQELIISICQEVITPNLTFNKSETENLKKKAKDAIEPVFFQIKKGETIVRDGELINELQLSKLNKLLSLKEEKDIVLITVGTALLISLLIIFISIYLWEFKHIISLNIKKIFLFCSILLETVLMLIVFNFIAESLANSMQFIEYSSFLYALPYALGAMLIALLLDPQFAFVFSIVVPVLASFLFSNSQLSYFLLATFGGFAATFGVIYSHHRTAIIKSGLFVSLVNLITITSLGFFYGNPFTIKYIYDIFAGVVGGLVVATLVSSSLPIYETLFKITTDITLLELSNLNHPLLQRLIVDASGTYHHSMMVAALAEAAANAIGANPLLARVSSYYHDIGKITKPDYFIENQQVPAKNKHDKLSTSMSSLIITSHVKEGVELAKEFKLSQAIIDIIQQHHGTSLLMFFYKKAKEQEDSHLQLVKESDYRYIGPKPQTKEAGIVMLADAIEATSRTLADPTMARLQGLVQKIMNNIFKDAQLDECDLTLKDLHMIANSFTRILAGIFHQRIDYPTREEITEEKEDNGDTNPKPTTEEAIRALEDERRSKEDIKRLGMP
ncbi:MAG: HDIG domain-containing metalloprotein [bacterium]